MPLPAVNDRDVEQLSRSDLILLVQKLSAALERSVEERTALRRMRESVLTESCRVFVKSVTLPSHRFNERASNSWRAIQQHDGYVAKHFTQLLLHLTTTAHTDARRPPDRESAASKLAVLQRAVTDAQLALANAAPDYEGVWLGLLSSTHTRKQPLKRSLHLPLQTQGWQRLMRRLLAVVLLRPGIAFLR